MFEFIVSLSILYYDKHLTSTKNDKICGRLSNSIKKPTFLKEAEIKKPIFLKEREIEKYIFH